ncbi:hypothetical protein CDL15_Pgr018397 [Punica granatum]|uniref:Uncharacterized protein n=1 Tax=Punica granatum TaxID=22663 RepID=A0A218W366_PUNGR|nr:hypothetical protein CDL15_Pgr018397 [Punica granatum]
MLRVVIIRKSMPIIVCNDHLLPSVILSFNQRIQSSSLILHLLVFSDYLHSLFSAPFFYFFPVPSEFIPIGIRAQSWHQWQQARDYKIWGNWL